MLRWITSAEITNAGFDIERKTVSSAVWQKAGSVKGNGTTDEQSCYSYTDRPGSSGVFNYRLKQIDFNGNFEYFELPEAVTIGIPDKYGLSQNYPNPFNPVTTINYDLPSDGIVTIKVYDMLGRELKTLVHEMKTAGYYKVQFNAAGIASGAYFYRLVVSPPARHKDGSNHMNSGEFVAVKKFTVLK
ncbi:MAG: T9SS type A sorting domain-containing protein [Ignavibacteria bacterium]|nr:T9SS type A sorting domain-containing protein [Ignavibacteria bacterium]